MARSFGQHKRRLALFCLGVHVRALGYEQFSYVLGIFLGGIVQWCPAVFGFGIDVRALGYEQLGQKKTFNMTACPHPSRLRRLANTL